MNTHYISKRISTPEWIKQIKTPHVSSDNRIPIYAPYLIGNENKYVNQALDTQWLSSKGDFIHKLEDEFAQYCGARFAISCSSGTTALFLALAANGIKKGDEVIVPTFTMISTAFAVSYTGASPIFVDCNEINGNIDADAVERLITSKTKAIIPVHIYGNPCEMNAIRKLAQKHHIIVIEDGAEALGSSYCGQKIGSISEFTCFSMYSNKIVTTGEGGMITLQSKYMYKKLHKLNNYAFSNIRHFWHQHIGYNYRLSNVQAAIGLAQVEHIEETLQKKKNVALWYRKLLQSVSEIFTEIHSAPHTQCNHWMIAYNIRNSRFSNMKLSTYLATHGIETRSFFLPIHLQPVYRKSEYLGRFPNAEQFARSGILLPSGPGLTQSEVERICETIIKFFKS